MIDHLSINTTNCDRGQTFYNAAGGALSIPRIYCRNPAISYGERLKALTRRPEE